jgi:hypothetical protein
MLGAGYPPGRKVAKVFQIQVLCPDLPLTGLSKFCKQLGIELQSIEDIGLLRMAGTTIFCSAASIVANLAGWFCQVREVSEMTMVMMWSARGGGVVRRSVRVGSFRWCGFGHKDG